MVFLFKEKEKEIERKNQRIIVELLLTYYYLSLYITSSKKYMT